MTGPDPGRVRVEMVFVHLGDGGEETYELQFVDDATGFSGSRLVVGPGGSLTVEGEDDE